MIIKHELQLDLVNKGHMPQIYAVQGDDASRVLAVALKENGNDWPIPDGVVPLVRYRKPDGTGGVYDTLPDGLSAWYMEAKQLFVILAPQMLTVPGCVETQIQLSQGSDICASFSFQVLVEGDPSIGVMESFDYVNWNQWATEEIISQLSRLRESGAFDGATFLPEVSQEGVLTWTNDQGKENPEVINILDLFARQIGSRLLPLSGGTMTGNIAMGGNQIKDLGTPTENDDAVPKSYVDDGFVPAVESADHPGCYYRIVDSDTQWLNAPMILGVEYLTAQRWNGKPVYVKAVGMGTLVNNSSKRVDLGLSAVSEIVDYCVVAKNDLATMVCTYTSGVTSAFVEGLNTIVLSTSIDLSPYTGTAIVQYVK